VSYLLIAFIIAVVISPLLWLQLSPAQARATAFRQRARELGLRVQLVADIDAEDQDRRPGTVRYLRPYQVTTTAAQRDKVGSWTLMRNHRRGWDSPWPQWRWFRSEAPAALHPHLEQLLAALPEVSFGVRADAHGVSVYLRESGEVAVVDQVARGLAEFVEAAGQP